VVEPIVLRPRAVEEQQKLANEISERLSQELVIALVGPVGSGVSTSARYIAEILKQQFGYDVAPIIGMSDILKRRLNRYLEIIFDTNIHTPTKFESAMYEATAAMAGSACTSRQTVYQPVAGSENQIS
jgi:ABC-type dipeptide/oligopeptide/nickel transport system ATPase subunit